MVARSLILSVFVKLQITTGIPLSINSRMVLDANVLTSGGRKRVGEKERRERGK